MLLHVVQNSYLGHLPSSSGRRLYWRQVLEKMNSLRRKGIWGLCVVNECVCVVIWIYNVPHWPTCFNICSPAGGAVLRAYGAFRKPDLVSKQWIPGSIIAYLWFGGSDVAFSLSPLYSLYSHKMTSCRHSCPQARLVQSPYISCHGKLYPLTLMVDKPLLFSCFYQVIARRKVTKTILLLVFSSSNWRISPCPNRSCLILSLLDILKINYYVPNLMLNNSKLSSIKTGIVAHIPT